MIIDPTRRIVCLERTLFDGSVTLEYLEEYAAHFVLYCDEQLGVTVRSARILKTLRNGEIPVKYDFSF